MPEKTVPLFSDQPSGVAKTTGTPTTKRNDTTINANKANWKIKSIALISLKWSIFIKKSFGFFTKRITLKPENLAFKKMKDFVYTF